MTDKLSERTERRTRPRFSVGIPVTVYAGDRALPGHALNVSDRGIYLYLSAVDGEAIERDFEFMLKLPPEITLSTWCSVRGPARVVRKQSTPQDWVGVAAEILHYSIIRTPVSSAGPGYDDLSPIS